MTIAAILPVAILLIVIVGGIIWISARRTESSMAAWRQEMQSAGAAQAQAAAAQMAQVAQLLTEQLGQVRKELQSGVATTGTMAANAQRDVGSRLESATAALRELSEKIGAIQQANKELSDASVALQNILRGTKSRGTLGEMALERLLADALPRSAYEVQFRFANGSIVDAIVRHGEQILPIDSKFPLDAYRRLADVGEDARREFSLAVRKHADAIAEKYILPAEHTTDFALMFIPSEGVFGELLMTEDDKYGRLEDYCRGKRIIPVSPNTCSAYLWAIATSLSGQRVAENARQIMAGLAGVEKQLEGFADVYDKLGTHLRNASKNYEEADEKLRRARASLERMAEGALAETPPKALGAATSD